MSLLGRIVRRVLSSPPPPDAEVRFELSDDAQAEVELIPDAPGCACGAPSSQQIDASPYGPKRTWRCGACGTPVGAH